MKNKSTPSQYKHADEPVVIKWKTFKDGRRTPSLYTTTTNKWLKFISIAEYNIAIKLGTPDLGDVK